MTENLPDGEKTIWMCSLGVWMGGQRSHQPNGAVGVFSCSLEGCSPYTANVSILGEQGTIVNDRFFLRKFEGQSDYFTLDTGVKKSGDVYTHPFPAMVEHFIECIQGEKESPHNLADAVNTHLCCMAIRKSAAAGGELCRIGNRQLIVG